MTDPALSSSPVSPALSSSSPGDRPRPHANAYWATPRLLASEYPGHRDPAEAARRLDAYARAGVTAFLDLTEPHDGPLGAPLTPYADRLPGTAAYVRAPIPDMGTVDDAALAAVLDRLDALLADGHTVCVHCWGGVGRTGTVVGTHLARHGLPGEAALAAVATHWATVSEAKRTRHPESPQTEAQRAQVRRWAPGR